MELDSTKVIRASMEAQQFSPFIALSIYRDNSFLNQRLAAVGCTNHVIVARLDNDLSELFPLSVKGSAGQNYTITDVTWNQHDPGRLAVSTTSGMVAVFGCDFWSSSLASANHSTPPLSMASSCSPNLGSSYPLKSSATSPGSSINTPLMTMSQTNHSSMGFSHPSTSSNMIGNNNILAQIGCIPHSSSITRKQEWDSGEAVSRAVHRLGWSNQDINMLGAACQDGHVRLFDTRTGKPSIDLTLKSIDAIRDVQFDPFSASNNLCSISENGTLCFWDPRTNTDCVAKVSAHPTGGALSLSYNPSVPGIVATGAKERLCKIWNYNDLTKAKPVHVIRTQASVGRIRWRGFEFDDELATSSPDRSEISVWSLRQPLIPGCVVRGHTEVCSDFDWLDTPCPTTFLPSSASMNDTRNNSQDSGSPPAFSRTDMGMVSNRFLGVNHHIMSVGKDGKVLVQDLRNGYFPRTHIATSVTAISSRGDVAYHRGEINRSDILGLTVSRVTASAPRWFADTPQYFGTTFQNADQEHLKRSRRSLSGDMASNSSSSAVALGEEDGTGGHNNHEATLSTSQSHSFFLMDLAPFNDKQATTNAPAPAGHVGTKVSFSHDTDASATAAPLTDRSVGGAVADHNSQHYSAIGSVFIGKAIISSLCAAREINSQHAAEGGVFDPATIKLLAMSYRIRGGVRACAENVNVAKSAGLLYRAALWNALHALLCHIPSQQPQPPLAQLPTPTRAGSTLAVDVADSASSGSGSGSGGSTTATPALPSPLPPVAPAVRQFSASSSASYASVVQNNASALPSDEVIQPVSTISGRKKMSLAFNATLIGDLLLDLVNCGDCQHFVSVCELVGEASTSLLTASLESAKIPKERQNEAYYSYISLLQKLRLFSEANYIIKMAKISAVAAAPAGINLKLYCETCGKEVPDNGSISYCGKCNKGSGLCSLCHRPVRGLFRWCQVCAHGGHNDCLTKWYRQSSTCPTGCGHNCTSELLCESTAQQHQQQQLARPAQRRRRHENVNSNRNN